MLLAYDGLNLYTNLLEERVTTIPERFPCVSLSKVVLIAKLAGVR